MFTRTVDIKCSFVCSNFVLFQIIRIVCFYYVFCFFRFIQFVLLYNKKQRNFQKFIEVKKKSSTHNQVLLSSRDGSSPSEVFLGKGVLKICSKFTGEHPCRSAILISCKVTSLNSHFSTNVLL